LERALLVEVRQPPVLQCHRLTGFVALALVDMPPGVGVERLARQLVGGGRGRAARQLAVERLNVVCGGHHQHAGSHGHDRVGAAFDQPAGHAAERVVGRADRALAGRQHDQPHAARLQHIRERVGRHQFHVAVGVLERQLALLTATQQWPRLGRRVAVEGAVAVEVQDMHRTPFVLEPLLEGRERGRAQ
jgi:hypothetical protein